MTERATPACAARPITSPSAELLLVVLVVTAGEPDEAPEAPEGDTVEELIVLSFVLEGVTEEEDDTLVVFVAVVMFLPPVRYGGAATAVDGSASAPVPQGIASPSGWVAFGGGVVAPDELAMANRPVHERFAAAGEENW